MERKHNIGFTLIELSIVLVIIGLIVGGVLVGRDLIEAAGIRAQISQIESYRTTVNTFRSKYGYLPGDLPNGSDFGFPASGGIGGEGDGNGLIEGLLGGVADGTMDDNGEGLVFWVDLSMAGLIPAGLTLGTYTTDVRFPSPSQMYPLAAINKGAYVFAWSYKGANWFSVHGFPPSGASNLAVYSALTPAQALAIDTKIDDGLPTSGGVLAMFTFHPVPIWSIAAGNPVNGWRVGSLNLSAALAGSATSCFDNNGVANTTLQYSMSSGGSNAQNCTLSFKFQ